MENHAQTYPSGRNVNAIPAAPAPDLEQLTRDFRTFVGDCETMLKNATALSGAGATVARAQLSEKMATAKVKLDSIRTTAGDQAQRVRESTAEYVRREPIMAIGAAAAVGAIVGLMMSRR